MFAGGCLRFFPSKLSWLRKDWEWAAGGQSGGIHLRDRCGRGVRFVVGDPHFSLKQGGGRASPQRLCIVQGQATSGVG